MELFSDVCRAEYFCKRKWPKWIGIQGVSAFEGARYYRKGIYRPGRKPQSRFLWNSNAIEADGNFGNTAK